jgi:hypothetical protein
VTHKCIISSPKGGVKNNADGESLSNYRFVTFFAFSHLQSSLPPPSSGSLGGCQSSLPPPSSGSLGGCSLLLFLWGSLPSTFSGSSGVLCLRSLLLFLWGFFAFVLCLRSLPSFFASLSLGVLCLHRLDVLWGFFAFLGFFASTVLMFFGDLAILLLCPPVKLARGGVSFKLQVTPPRASFRCGNNNNFTMYHKQLKQTNTSKNTSNLVVNEYVQVGTWKGMNK